MTDRFHESSGTDRYHEPCGTDRWQEDKERFTKPFNDAATAYNPLSLKTGELVDGRFRIVEQIIVHSGEADIYRCVDELTGKEAALKFYHHRYQPKTQIIDRLLKLRSPGLVSVIQYGVWSGRFYEAMEYCQGGMLKDYLPLDLNAIRLLLPPILNGLQYLHSEGIIHRDIKPENIYFRKSGMQELVIGDFGISSIMVESDQHTYRVSNQAWTVDYTAPELYANKVHPESDYYSLGITIIHAFVGASPFKGYTREAIGNAHGTGNIPKRDELPNELKYLVVGLTQLNPRNRWQYRQVMQWLKGETVLANDGSPWKEDIYYGKEKPYPNYPEAKTPVELAAALNKFDAKNDLFRGWISGWIFNHFNDAEMAKKIVFIEENYGDRRDLAIVKLAFVLDPKQPLQISVNRVVSIETLCSFLNDSKYSEEFKNALFGYRIEEWIRTAFDGDQARHRSANFLETVRNQHSTDRDLALWAMRWHFTPSLGFPFKSAVAKTPKDLAQLIDTDASSRSEGNRLLQNGWIKTWLVTTGQITPGQFDQLNAVSGSWERKVETLIQLLDDKIATPKPSSSVSKVEFGSISTEGQKSTTVTIKNSGRGHLSGSVYLEGNGSGITMEEKNIEGDPVTVTITAKALGLPVGSTQVKNIVVSTNGGTIKIPVTFTITAPIARMLGRSLLCGIITAVSFWGFRKILGEASGAIGNVLPLVSSADQLPNVNGGFVFLLALLFIPAFFGYLYYLLSIRRRLVQGK